MQWRIRKEEGGGEKGEEEKEKKRKTKIRRTIRRSKGARE